MDAPSSKYQNGVKPLQLHSHCEAKKPLTVMFNLELPGVIFWNLVQDIAVSLHLQLLDQVNVNWTNLLNDKADTKLCKIVDLPIVSLMDWALLMCSVILFLIPQLPVAFDWLIFYIFVVVVY